MVLILKNATLLSLEPREIIYEQDIIIEGTNIVDVGNGLAKLYTETSVIDLKGKLTMPGLVCSHNHFYSSLARGIMADIKESTDFVSVLTNLWWRLDRAIDEETLYLSALTAALDAIKCGTTSVIDHHASPNFIKGSLKVLKQAFDEVGLRGILCYESTNRNNEFTETILGIEENIRFALICEKDKLNTNGDYLVESMIGGHAAFTISNDGLKLMRDAIKQTGRGLHIHVAEDRYDSSYSHHKYQQHIIERLCEYELINNKAILAHGVYLLPKEIKMLNDHHGTLIHNARSNMNNNVGYNMNLPLYQNCALGTDGIGSDMISELKFAYFKHKDSGGKLWPNDFLTYLHKGNDILNKYFTGSFGKLAKGHKADITILDYVSPTPMTKENLGGHFIFGLDAKDVHTVIINGKVLLQNKEFTFNTEPVYTKARLAAKRLWDNMNKL